MATSGVALADFTADDLLTEAWERCGFTGQVLNGETARSARRSLELMLLDWANRGLNLWQVQDTAFTLVPNVTDEIVLPAGIAAVLEVTVQVGTSDLLLTPISRDEWVATPNRQLRTRPTAYWLERVNPSPILHVYPLPSATISGTYWAVRLPERVGGLSNTIDAPVLWQEALASGLAARLALKFAPQRLAMLKGEAAEAFAAAAGENRERVPLTIKPGRRR